MGKNTKSGKLTGLSEKSSDIILVVLCTIILLIVAYPLYYVLIASVSNPYDVYAGKTFLLPSQFTLDGYKSVFADPVSCLDSLTVLSIRSSVRCSLWLCSIWRHIP